jgi:hypothetical protein
MQHIVFHLPLPLDIARHIFSFLHVYERLDISVTALEQFLSRRQTVIYPPYYMNARHTYGFRRVTPSTYVRTRRGRLRMTVRFDDASSSEGASYFDEVSFSFIRFFCLSSTAYIHIESLSAPPAVIATVCQASTVFRQSYQSRFHVSGDRKSVWGFVRLLYYPHWSRKAMTKTAFFSAALDLFGQLERLVDTRSCIPMYPFYAPLDRKSSLGSLLQNLVNWVKEWRRTKERGHEAFF